LRSRWTYGTIPTFGATTATANRSFIELFNFSLDLIAPLLRFGWEVGVWEYNHFSILSGKRKPVPDFSTGRVFTHNKQRRRETLL
jgi:hypothetical protein